MPEFLKRNSAKLVHQRQRRTIFICSVIVLMSVLSAIGLVICEPSKFGGLDDNDENGSGTVAPHIVRTFNTNETQLTTTEREKEIKLNVYVSATIHHNITINGPIAVNNVKPESTVDNQQQQQQPTYAILESIITDNFTTNTSTLTSAPASSIVRKSIANALNLSQSAMPTINLLENSLESFEDSNRAIILMNATNENENGTVLFSIANMKTHNDDKNSECSHPEYIVFTWILCLTALATALKLYFLVKSVMAIILVACYSILIWKVFPSILAKQILQEEQSRAGMPLSIQMFILLAVFLVMVGYHARLVEVGCLIFTCLWFLF